MEGHALLTLMLGLGTEVHRLHIWRKIQEPVSSPARTSQLTQGRNDRWKRASTKLKYAPQLGPHWKRGLWKKGLRLQTLNRAGYGQQA